MCSFVITSGGTILSTSLPAEITSSPFARAAFYNFSNRAALDHDSLHEAHASSCCSAFMFCNNFIQFLFQIWSHFLYMFNDLIILINVKYFADCSTYKRVSTISCTMITWLQRSFGSFLIQI